MYQLGTIFSDHPGKGDRMILPTAITISLKVRATQEFLSATMRLKIVTAKGRQTQNVPVSLENLQHITIRKQLTELVAQTGYRPSDFCLLGELEYVNKTWKLAGDPKLITSVIVMNDAGITTLRVLNRDILYTDGAHWYSGNARLTDLRSGINELKASLKTTEKPVSGFIGASDKTPGVFVWAPRLQGDRLANDTLAELERLYPLRKGSLLSSL